MPSRPVRLAGVGVLALVAVTSAAALTVQARAVEPDDVASSRALQHLVPTVARALDPSPARGGPDRRYVVTWTDPVGLVGELQAYGLLNELDRRGIPVGLERSLRLRAAPRLTLDRARATAVLNLVTGPAIETWNAMPGALRIASYDPRTPAQRARQLRLRAEIDRELSDLGLPDLIPQVEALFMGSFFLFKTDPRIPRRLIEKMQEVWDLGTPSAVFIGPP